MSVVRLPQVHDPYKQGLVPWLIRLKREKGEAAYIGEGLNRWAAAHISDVALLYRLVVEKGKAGVCYHAVGEEGVTMREIAESIGRGLKLPIVSISPGQAAAHFGLIAMFAATNMPASSVLTQQWLDWHPSGPGLIADLDEAKF